jgi:hypothetical protein
VARAVELEESAAAEERSQLGHGQTVRAFNEPHAAAIRRAYPGANVVQLRSRPEEIPDAPA